MDHILPAEGQHWVSPTFVCRIVSGTPAILEPGKCADIGWFAPTDVPRELTVISRKNLDNYIRFISRTSLKVEPWP